MDWMTEQRAHMVAPVKLTALGRQHGSLALVINDVYHATVAITKTTSLTQLPTIKPAIGDSLPQCELHTLQAKTQTLQNGIKLREAVTNIGVQCIIDCFEEQYIKELNKDYFGYANQIIRPLLKHLCTNWCNVMHKERMDTTNAFYHTCHHIQLPTDKTRKEMPSHQRYHC
jgi:hypothetical protein